MAVSRRTLIGAASLGALAVAIPLLLRRRHTRGSGAHAGLIEGDPVWVREGFTATVLTKAGDPMSDGFVAPGMPDGMAAFDRGEHVVLLRNHELAEERALSAYPEGPVPEAAFDKGFYGAVTRVVVAKKDLRVVSQNLVLTGTSRNCAGGASPWGWLSCEEDPRAGHGYVFACDADATALAPPRRIDGYGRFRHEAVAVDPSTLTAYLTEDQPDGCLYRFVPRSPKTPHEGTLSALALVDGRRSTASWKPGDSGEVRWVELADPTPKNDELRRVAAGLGAALVMRGEGIFLRTVLGRPAITFAATGGGAGGRGQLFELEPTPDGGTLRCSFAVAEGSNVDMPDNLHVTDRGLVIVAEDGEAPNGVRVVTPSGEVLSLCENTGQGEVAGVTLLGDTLFFNLQQRGLTLALRGPFEALG